MKHYKRLLGRFGPVMAFDYPYMKEGRKRPDQMPKLLQAHGAALAKGRKKHGERVILVGKSMGGRMGCHLALEEEVLGVICLGYPLKGMGKAGNRAIVKTDLSIACPAGTYARIAPRSGLAAKHGIDVGHGVVDAR